MKKTGLILLLAAFMISFGCQKEGNAPAMSSVTGMENAVWRTPTGYVIPDSEKDHWEEYLQANLVSQKDEIKYYGSKKCDPEGATTCGLECVKVTKASDCIRVSACAPCTNCCITQ